MSEPGTRLQKRVLVTGASGFIGSRLCDELLRLGAEVHGVSRRAVEGGADVRWWRNDLSDAAAVKGLLAEVKPALIFHLAAAVSGRRDLDAVTPMLQDNLVGGVNLMVAATKQGCERLVMAGSLEEPDATESVPVSPYAAAKGAAYSYGRMMHGLYGTPVVNARLFMVFGPGQRDIKKLVPYSILSFLRGEAPRIQSAERAIDWVYVDDVVQGLIACGLAQGLEGTAVDIGSGELHTVREVVEALGVEMQASQSPVFGETAGHPERVRVADVQDARERAGWAPAIGLREGLRRTIAWYEDAVRDGALVGVQQT